MLEKSVCVGGGGGGGVLLYMYICIQKAYFVCKTCGFYFVIHPVPKKRNYKKKEKKAISASQQLSPKSLCVLCYLFLLRPSDSFFWLFVYMYTTMHALPSIPFKCVHDV